MWPIITRNWTDWTLATIHHKPDSYCLLLARSTIHKLDRCRLRLVRSTYYGSHPWCVVLMFSPIFLPRILHYIEFVYAHCYSRRLRIRVCVSGWLLLYCNMTNEYLTLTWEFNMLARVRVQVNVTFLSYVLQFTRARIASPSGSKSSRKKTHCRRRG